MTEVKKYTSSLSILSQIHKSTNTYINRQIYKKCVTKFNKLFIIPFILNVSTHMNNKSMEYNINRFLKKVLYLILFSLRVTSQFIGLRLSIPFLLCIY